MVKLLCNHTRQKWLKHGQPELDNHIGAVWVKTVDVTRITQDWLMPAVVVTEFTPPNPHAPIQRATIRKHDITRPNTCHRHMHQYDKGLTMSNQSQSIFTDARQYKKLLSPQCFTRF